MIRINETNAYNIHSFDAYEDAEEFCCANNIDVSWIEPSDTKYEVATPNPNYKPPSVTIPKDRYIIKGTKHLVSDTQVCINSGKTYEMKYESIGNPPSIFKSVQEANSVINRILSKKYKSHDFNWVIEKLV